MLTRSINYAIYKFQPIFRNDVLLESTPAKRKILCQSQNVSIVEYFYTQSESEKTLLLFHYFFHFMLGK